MRKVQGQGIFGLQRTEGQSDIDIRLLLVGGG